MDVTSGASDVRPVCSAEFDTSLGSGAGGSASTFVSVDAGSARVASVDETVPAAGLGAVVMSAAAMVSVAGIVLSVVVVVVAASRATLRP